MIIPNDVVSSKRTLRLPFLSVVGIATISILYAIAVFAPFLAPYDYREQSRRQPSAPSSTLRFREDGIWVRPYVREWRLTDARNLTYTEVESDRFPLSFFVRGSAYTFLGVFRTDRHLFGTEPTADGKQTRVHLLGTDQLGRDRFSRLLFAIRFSLVVSPLGVILASFLGVIFGSLSGYGSSRIDGIMMAIADTTIALPTLILILAARAAFPLELPAFSAATLLISIFALTGWGEMARLTRGLVVSMRQREFVLAARATGVTETRILFRHIVPNIASPLIQQASLMLPAFFLAEITLSFLGVGLQEPEASLGNMLSSANDFSIISNSPFTVLSPAIVIFLFVFAVRAISSRKDGRLTGTGV